MKVLLLCSLISFADICRGLINSNKLFCGEYTHIQFYRAMGIEMAVGQNF